RLRLGRLAIKPNRIRVVGQIEGEEVEVQFHVVWLMRDDGDYWGGVYCCYSSCPSASNGWRKMSVEKDSSENH
ncbi:MAG: hypothetical protein ACXADB_13185, partial [Candidatus Hermodarchaeia archaeon]